MGSEQGGPLLTPLGLESSSDIRRLIGQVVSPLLALLFYFTNMMGGWRLGSCFRADLTYLFFFSFWP